MFSEKCKLHGLNGIKRLDRVGNYLVIANKWLYETGTAQRYALVNKAEPTLLLGSLPVNVSSEKNGHAVTLHS